MSLFRTLRLIAIVASVVSTTPNIAHAQNESPQDIDRSIKPGDDFYRYANGGWLGIVTIPAGQSSYDTRAMLKEKTSQRVRDLIEDAAATHPANGSVAQKVGDYYASFMDEDGIEVEGSDATGRRNGHDLSDHK